MKPIRIFNNYKELAVFSTCVCLLFMTLLVVHRPLDILDVDRINPQWSIDAYFRLLIFLCMGLLVVSHVMLYASSKNRQVPLLHFPQWLLAENLIISLILALVAYRMHEGMSSFPRLYLRIMIIMAVALPIPYHAAVMLILWGRRNEHLKGLVVEFHRIRSRNEKMPAGHNQIMLLDRHGKFQMQIDSENIIYIQASNNYCNICYAERGDILYCIIHNTISNLTSAFEGTPVVRCHRSYLINLSQVSTAVREHGHIAANMKSVPISIPVSKSYVQSVREFIDANGAR